MGEQILHMQELNANKVNVALYKNVLVSATYNLQKQQLNFQNKTL